ncbi:MAG: hypothetical protein ACRC10_11635 [Thermoguttaceae bacterium]
MIQSTETTKLTESVESGKSVEPSKKTARNHSNVLQGGTTPQKGKSGQRNVEPGEDNLTPCRLKKAKMKKMSSKPLAKVVRRQQTLQSLNELELEKTFYRDEEGMDIEFDDTSFFEDEILSLEEFDRLATRPADSSLKNKSGHKKEGLKKDRGYSFGQSLEDRGIAEIETSPIERRAKVQRRRQIDPTTCERDYTFAELEFMSALDEYKRNSGRMFPTCSEILEVLLGLGYTKPTTTQPTEPLTSETVSAELIAFEDNKETEPSCSSLFLEETDYVVTQHPSQTVQDSYDPVPLFLPDDDSLNPFTPEPIRGLYSPPILV